MHDRKYCPEAYLEPPAQGQAWCCRCGGYFPQEKGTVFRNGEFACESCWEDYLDLYADGYQEDYLEARREDFLEYVCRRLA